MDPLRKTLSAKQALVVFLGLLILIGAFLYFYQPFEKARLSRDQKRIEELTKLKEAIDTYLKNNPGKEGAMCDRCEVGKTIFAAAPISSDGSFYIKNVVSTAVNITGWVPIDFSLNAKIGETPIKVLPVDPTNVHPYVFTYTPGKNASYKLTAALESTQNDSLEKDDGGINENRYEVGSDLSLPP